MTDLLAITNGRAGTADDHLVDASLALIRQSCDVEVARTSDPDDLAETLTRHEELSTVLVLGGDGSIHAVVAALYAADRLGDVEVGLIPLGTGNDLARSLGISDDATTAAGQFVDGTPTKVDLVTDDEDNITVNATHAGVGAAAGVAAKPWKRMFGPVGYAVGSVVSGVAARGLAVEIFVDGDQVLRKGHRGRILQVAVGNGRYVGGGAPMFPNADPGDGMLDVSISYANPWHRRLAYAASLRRGQHHRRKDVISVRGREVRVTGEPYYLNSDGEITEGVTDRTWTIRPGAVTMRLPDAP